MQRDELFPVPDKPQKWILVLIGCALVSWFVLIVGIEPWANPSDAPTTWPGTWSLVHDGTIYNYPELIEDYKEPTRDASPWFCVLAVVFIALQLTAIGLIIYIARGCLLYILANALVFFVAGMLWFGAAMMHFGDSTTYLYHQQTLEFESQAYQLTIEKYITSDPHTERWRVLLFECDDTGEQCRIRYAESDYNYYEEPEASLEIDAASGALQLSAEDKLVFEISPNP